MLLDEEGNEILRLDRGNTTMTENIIAGTYTLEIHHGRGIDGAYTLFVRPGSTYTGGDCPGCDSVGRFCHGPRIEIAAPAGVNADALTRHIAGSLGAGDQTAVGSVSPGVFYLDVSGLAQTSQNTVLGLLSATGAALRGAGQAVDLEGGMNAASQILSD